MSSRTPLSVASTLLVAALLVPAVASATPQPLQIQGLQAPSEAKGALPARPEADRPYPPGLRFPAAPLGQGYVAEVEPNNTFATATPLGGTNVVARGNIYPNADVDWYSFTGAIGDRVYAATMTSFSASASTDSQLRIFQPDGTTLIEFDDDDGSLGGLSSSIAGATLTAAGTHFIEVRHFSATNQLRPYDLHFRLQSGSPTAEVEPNGTPATATPLPASGWIVGAVTPAADADFFSLTLAAGDTVFASLDMNPERDGTTWNGRLGVALFGTALNQILVVNDGSVTSPNSEAIFMTVKNPGTYFIYVDEPAAGGSATFTYNLSVSVHPAANEGINCTTYTSTDVPQAIPTGPGSVTSTLTIPGSPRIADLDVSLDLTHANMPDLDIHLISPAGNDNGLLSDVGAAAQSAMSLTLDDEAGIPVGLFTIVSPIVFTPELSYRLSWFDGENAGGTWTLQIRDDTAANGGTLTGWSLRVCEPAPPAACAPGFLPTTVFSTDFEAGAAGFTHSGTADEWELGLPATAATSTSPPVAAFTTCNSGVNCWKTDLDNTYNNAASGSVTQNLLSPNINLAGLSAPVVVTWAHRHQVENATFDHYYVDYQQAGGATPVRLFEWLDATPTDSVGNPTVNIGESSGWGVFSRRADALAGLNTELLFHMDQDNSIALGGVAVDDVSVTACRPLSSNLAINKTDGATTEIPGTPVTYTIVASNAGPDPVVGGTVADTFPAILSGCSWTCVGTLGGTCTAGPVSGNINDTVNLPNGASVTYTATCNISAAATGSLSNTATVSSANPDPDPANNSWTDVDTLTPQGDLAITKTDGAATEIPGTPVTYTIVASNSGPSNAPGSNVVDTFPAILSGCTWTCVGAVGGTCTANGAGNINDTVNLPAGGSVTYTATCNISPAATGTLTNIATVGTGTGVSDPAPANNSATDSDTLTPQGDLAITKTDGLTNATPGQATTYTLVATNSGPSNVPTATVADTFPAAYTGVAWTCVGGGGATCPANGAGNINAAVNLPVGGTVTFTVNGTISGAFTGTLSNTATVTAGGGASDPNGANNSATDTTEVGSPASVSGTKSVAGTFLVGETITYTVDLYNAGPGAQLDNPGDEFSDTLPPQLTLVSAVATSGTVGTAGNTVTWNGSIPALGSVTLTIEATINPGTGGQLISNQGTIWYDADGDGTNEATALTDDPNPPGTEDPTDFIVSEIALEIPTLSTLGFALLALALAGLGLALLRRRSA